MHSPSSQPTWNLFVHSCLRLLEGICPEYICLYFLRISFLQHQVGPVEHDFTDRLHEHWASIGGADATSASVHASGPNVWDDHWTYIEGAGTASASVHASSTVITTDKQFAVFFNSDKALFVTGDGVVEFVSQVVPYIHYAPL